MISLVLASLGRIKKRSSLLHLAGEGIGPPVGEAGLLRNLMMMIVMLDDNEYDEDGLLGNLLSLPLLLLIGALSLPHLALVSLDGL